MPEYDERKVGRTCVECECNFISRFPWQRCEPCRKAFRASLRYEIYLKHVPVRLRPRVADALVGNEWVIVMIVVAVVLSILIWL